MRASFTALLVTVLVTALDGCASSRPAPPPVASPQPEPQHEEQPAAPVAKDEAPPEAAAASELTTPIDAPERDQPPSTATYDEALSTPEPVDVDDTAPHLTDNQLTSPMRGVLRGCRVPANTKVTIKTAVQRGRAIGVTVDARYETANASAKPKVKAKGKPASRATAASTKKIAACVDRNVRAVVWPPNRRRDSFTMEF
jgi:hypothetical protein